jgi:hypothetical protein
MAVILITPAVQNNMSCKCFITLLNTNVLNERSGSDLPLLLRCLRPSHTLLSRRKVISLIVPPTLGYKVDTVAD